MMRQRKNGWKMVLDLIMAIVLVLLYNKRALGIAFHEIAGLAICGLFIIHKLLNWKWIQSVTLRLFSHSTPIRQKMLWVLDLFLLLCFGYVLVSGIMISKVVFPSSGGNSSFKMGHYAVAALALALAGIHVGLHMSWMKQRMPFLNRWPLLLRRGLAIVLSVAVLAFGTIQFMSTDMLRWLGSLGNVWSTSSTFTVVEGAGHEQSEETVTTIQSSSDADQTAQTADSTASTDIQSGADTDQTTQTTDSTASTDMDTQSGFGSDNGNAHSQGQGFADGSGPRGGGTGSGTGNSQNASGGVGSVLLSFMSILLAFAVLTAWVDFGFCVLRRRKRLAQKNHPTMKTGDAQVE